MAAAERVYHISEIPEKRIHTISSGCYERAYLLQCYLEGKSIHVPEEYLITEADVERFKYTTTQIGR